MVAARVRAGVVAVAVLVMVIAMTAAVATAALAEALVVKIDRDLSLKHVGPLALARLYGEFCMVQFRYCMSKNDESDSLAEKCLSVIPNGRKYLSLIRILDILHALKYHLYLRLLS